MLPGLVLMTALCLLAFGTVGAESITITGKGTGKDREAAVQSALQDALRQVNGLNMVATQKTRRDSVQLSVTDPKGDSSTVKLEANSQSSTTIDTKGVISSYQIEDVGSENGLVAVTIRAVVERYSAPGISTDSRRKLAVMPFGAPSDDIGRKVTQQAVSQLVQSRRFAVLDRENDAAYVAEASRWASNLTRVQEKAKLAQQLGADYLLVATVSSFDAKVQTQTLALTGESKRIVSGYGVLQYRVLVPATMQVKWAADIAVTLDRPAEAADSAPEDMLAAELAGRLNTEIVESIYPLQVISTDASGQIVINQGGASVREGSRYAVYTTGKTLYDPYTKESLGKEEVRVATLEIVEVKPKYAVARVVPGAEPAAAVPVGAICRSLPDDGGAAQARQGGKADLVERNEAGGGVKLPFD
ncbi:hypothetical protein DSM19430T_27300 [Desulfovibrio psychrotolerans]|uniref:Curli production assembly/transport component CsgG n=2 Tax=Desulfovibrio psychrotolerans TaxID=415242 RepID=A0A7J0BWE6_9BACT|nr:hypothetical protein DSM19430T_27300 [Desulfovibrio psychrotolerans]